MGPLNMKNFINKILLKIKTRIYRKINLIDVIDIQGKELDNKMHITFECLSQTLDYKSSGGKRKKVIEKIINDKKLYLKKAS
ncbi:MAG: hypothetical protein R3321_06660, partial [Nitrososphaeraceae archaeon]|nr:hypothetical protein [Nitrososphaeraceae archaeon]